MFPTPNAIITDNHNKGEQKCPVPAKETCRSASKRFGHDRGRNTNGAMVSKDLRSVRKVLSSVLVPRKVRQKRTDNDDNVGRAYSKVQEKRVQIDDDFERMSVQFRGQRSEGFRAVRIDSCTEEAEPFCP